MQLFQHIQKVKQSKEDKRKKTQLAGTSPSSCCQRVVLSLCEVAATPVIRLMCGTRINRRYS